VVVIGQGRRSPCIRWLLSGLRTVRIVMAVAAVVDMDAMIAAVAVGSRSSVMMSARQVHMRASRVALSRVCTGADMHMRANKPMQHALSHQQQRDDSVHRSSSDLSAKKILQGISRKIIIVHGAPAPPH
jgi:hypothetical protein